MIGEGSVPADEGCQHYDVGGVAMAGQWGDGGRIIVCFRQAVGVLLVECQSNARRVPVYGH